MLYAPKYETMEGIDEGSILPVDFVSADLDANLLTFRIPVPDSVLCSIASVQPGTWIKVTTPMQQAPDVPSLASAGSPRPAVAQQAEVVARFAATRTGLDSGLATVLRR